LNPRYGASSASAKEGYAVLVTTDSNVRYQQNLERRRIAIAVPSTPSWRRLQQAIAYKPRRDDRAD
jgi:hypothetical protein